MCAKRKTPKRLKSILQLTQAAQKPNDDRFPVLYVHPAKQGTGLTNDENLGRSYGVIPVGLPALVNVLRDHQIPVRGVIHPLEVQLNPAFNLADWLKSHASAKVILIDLHWYEHCYGAIDTAQLCASTLPDAWIVLGGLSATGWSKEILENFKDIDFIIRGDAEKPLLELVQMLLAAKSHDEVFEKVQSIWNVAYLSADGVVENPETYCAGTEDLDKLNFVDLDFIEHYREYFVHEYIVTDLETAHKMLTESTPNLGRWLTTARGCKYNCSYCGGSRTAHKLLAGRIGVVARSPDKIVDDLEKLSQLGVVQASMAYDIAELGEEYWESLFEGMKRRGIKIGLYNEFFQMPSLAFIDAMAETVDLAHSPVAISPLSGNEHVRRLNGKHYSNDQLFDLLEGLNNHNMFIFVYFSLNLPWETRETFEETKQLAKEIYEFYPTSLMKILNTVHTIDPLSPMNMAPEKYGIQSSMKTFKDYFLYCFNTQYSDPRARNGEFRGYDLVNPADRSLEEMANAWDNLRKGREKSVWPIPPSW